MSASHRLAEVFIGTSVLCWLLMVALIVMFARLRTARRHYAELQESFAQGGRKFRIQAAMLSDAQGVIRSLEATVADTSRLLTDAQGTIAVLEEHVSHADLQRDVALAAGRASHARIDELERRAIDLETRLAVAQRAVSEKTSEVSSLRQNISNRDDRIVSYAEQLAAAREIIADLEARLRLPEPGPADLVLLDAEVHPERLTDAPVDVPEGCRVETVRYHAQTRVRGPGGKFISLAKAGDSAPPGTTNYMGGGGKGLEIKNNPVEPGSTITVTIGGEPEDCA